MRYFADVTLAVLSTTLCLAVAFIFFAFIIYALDKMEKRKGNDAKMARIEAIYTRWEVDMDYTTLQAISDIGELFAKEGEDEEI